MNLHDFAIPTGEGSSIITDRVDVWRAGLDIGVDSLERLSKTLSQDEMDRADRFVRDRDRRRFIVARGCLRKVLSRYLETEPEEVLFGYGTEGKPFLRTKTSIPIYFNLAHSAELALIAVTGMGEVGVDVEELREEVDRLDLARRYFSAREFEDLSSLPEEDQSLAFYRCWTRKEAYLKAKGGGITESLAGFSVSLLPDDPAALLENDDGDSVDWGIVEIQPSEGYIGAVAMKKRKFEVEGWDAGFLLARS